MVKFLAECYKESPRQFLGDVFGALFMGVMFYIFTVLMFCM